MQWESISRKWKRRAWPFQNSRPLSPISSVPGLVLNLFLSQIFALDQSLEAAKSGKEHRTSSHRRPIGRVSGVGADIWEGCLHTAHLVAGGSQHGSLFKESLALLSLSYSLLLPCLLHCFQPRLLSLSTVPIVSQAASRLIEDHEESTETICRLCIIVERIWSMMMKNGLKAAVCSFWSVNYWPTVLKVEIISR